MVGNSLVQLEELYIVGRTKGGVDVAGMLDSGVAFLLAGQMSEDLGCIWRLGS